jgi:hypothetical protein
MGGTKRSRSASAQCSGSSGEVEGKDALRALDMELRRSCCAYNMGKELHASCEEAGIDSMSLFVGFVFETIAQRTVYEASKPADPDTRVWLHPFIDSNRELLVRQKDNHNFLGVLGPITFVGGAIQACVTLEQDHSSTQSPLELWEPCSPIPLYLDAMLPCGEVVLPHKSPMSVFQLCLSKLCDADKTKSKSFNAKKRIAWSIADRASRLAFEARRELLTTLPEAAERRVAVAKRVHGEAKEGDANEVEVVLSLEGTPSDRTLPFETVHVLVDWQYRKLRGFYKAQRPFHDGCEGSEALFHLRLFTMLQRYTGVTGLFSRIEAGWHAAVPPEPFDYLRYVMDAEAEGFASPLNARMSKFCSAFQDTDHFFGSQGPFHRFFPRHGCFEVGPPYDHEVIRIAFAHAITCLEAPECDGPLCFVFIIPESQRDAGLAVRQQVESSGFKQVSEVISRLEAKYIDGFQHRPGENRLITISCDTRIIILQNSDAAQRWPARSHFEELRRRWVQCQATIDTHSSPE